MGYSNVFQKKKRSLKKRIDLTNFKVQPFLQVAQQIDLSRAFSIRNSIEKLSDFRQNFDGKIVEKIVRNNENSSRNPEKMLAGKREANKSDSE